MKNILFITALAFATLVYAEANTSAPTPGVAKMQELQARREGKKAEFAQKREERVENKKLHREEALTRINEQLARIDERLARAEEMKAKMLEHKEKLTVLKARVEKASVAQQFDSTEIMGDMPERRYESKPVGGKPMMRDERASGKQAPVVK